jgi:hypothetical protein
MLPVQPETVEENVAATFLVTDAGGVAVRARSHPTLKETEFDTTPFGFVT